MHRILLFLLIPLNAGVAISQDRKVNSEHNYHLIYLDISENRNRQNLTTATLGLLDDVLQSGDVFHLFFSNGHLPEIFQSGKNFTAKDRDRLVELLQHAIPSPPNINFDKDNLLNIWDSTDIKGITADNRTLLLYERLYLHYFISSGLFRLQEEELVDRLLLVKDLTRKHIDPGKIYIKFYFDNEFKESFLRRQKQIFESNPAGYNYEFISY